MAGWLAVAGIAAAAPAQDSVLTLTVGQAQRTAYLHVPAGIDRTRHYPLVIGFHGGGANGQGYLAQAQPFQ